MLSLRKRPRVSTKWAAIFLSALSCSCKKAPKEQITLQVGPLETIRFEAASGFAHYYELPGKDDELRIFVSSYPLGCQKYEPPPPGEALITVTLRKPSPDTIATGTYPWNGLNVQTDEENNSAGLSNAAASALPFVRLAEDARALPAGGMLHLTRFEPETYGLVEGEFAFRDAGPGQVARAALSGRFSVRMCHLQLDAARRAQNTLR